MTSEADNLELDGRPEAVPAARRFVRGLLHGWGLAELAGDAELVTSELVANAVIHAGGPVGLWVSRMGEAVQIEVADPSPVAPFRRRPTERSTTGRGLGLVGALADDWGVTAEARIPPGGAKTVWCRLALRPVAGPTPAAHLDNLDDLLASFPDLEPDEQQPSAPRFTIDIGDAPTELVLAAKDHLDDLVRELTLASNGGRTGGSAAALPAMAAHMDRAILRFADIRQQIRKLCLEARDRGDARVRLVLTVGADAPDAGEAYLDALEAADRQARDARLLTLESPVEFRVLRRWYVGVLVEAVRRTVAGLPARTPPTFESRLVAALHDAEGRAHASLLAARLQNATAELSEAENPEQVAEIAVGEGLASLGASGGVLLRVHGGEEAVLAEQGLDVGVVERSRGIGRPAGPSTVAMTTRAPVYVEDAAARNARFPHLAELQPGAVAFAALPLTVAGQIWGALRFSFAGPRPFDAGEKEYLAALASQAGQAIARVEAFRRLAALRDELEALLTSPDLPGPLADEAEGIAAVDLAVLRSLYEDVPVGVAVVDTEGRFLRLNRALSRELAAGPDRGGLQELFGAHASVLGELLSSVVSTGEAVVDRDVYLPRPGRADDAWRTSWLPVRDRDGAIQAVVVFATDVTDARRAERRHGQLTRAGETLAAATTTDSVLRVVMDFAVPVWVDWAVVHLVDEDGEIRCAAVRHHLPAEEERLRRLFERFPVTRDQPAGAGWVIAHGASHRLDVVEPAVVEAVAEGDAEFVEVIASAGTVAGASVPLVARGRTVGALSIARSATAPLDDDELAMFEDLARRAGVALGNAEVHDTSIRLDLALTAAQLGSFDLDLATGRLAWDDRLIAMFGFAGDGFGADLDSFFSRVHPEDRDAVRDAINRAVEQCGDLAVSYRIRLPGGDVRWIEARGRALPGQDGAANRLLGTAADVTDVRLRNDRLTRTLEMMGDAFFSVGPDWVLTYVNREAERLLSRGREELIGKNIWEEFPEAIGGVFEENYKRAVATGTPARFEAFFAPLDRLLEVRAYPTPEGLSVYFTDIAARRVAEAERDLATSRLGLMDRIGTALSATLDVNEALTRLAEALVPTLADVVSIDLVDDHVVRPVVVVGDLPHHVDAVRRAEEARPRRDTPGSAVQRVLAEGKAVLMAKIPPDHHATVAVDPEQRRLWEQTGLASTIVVPLAARGRVLGAMSLLRMGPSAVRYGVDDLSFAVEVGRRAGIQIDNAAQYTAQRQVAEALQRSLLPELPALPGLAVAAAYEPSGSAAKVGGDWYDAFVLPDGGVGVVIGDVMGHDIAAAAAMGQLRSVLRTCAADGDSPAVVLDRLDRLVDSFSMADLATVIYARLNRLPDGSAELAFANAGHPPPLLLNADGTARYLDGAPSIMIGAPSVSRRREVTHRLPAGSALVLFTDGVIERRGRDLDSTLSDLRTAAAALWGAGTPVGELCRALIELRPGDVEGDDAAALAVALV